MGPSTKAVITAILTWFALSGGLFITVVNGNDFNYKEALSKAILFLEAQRSGKLENSRIPWRGDSGLDDGKIGNVDLVGGYYDAGDNVKFGFPMAFTITTLSWGTMYYGSEMKKAGELDNALSAIKWGTDYFLKASAKRNVLWVQVGDPEVDHCCWMRPENMKTPRRLYRIDEHTPGSEIAAETSAAMAASSIVFKGHNKTYARKLLNKAKWLYEFAKTHRGTYDGECPYYCSYSGYHDELLWAGTWLYIATHKPKYLKSISQEFISSYVDEFNWDLKYAASQILLTKEFLKGEKSLQNFKSQANSYICSVHPESPSKRSQFSKGGLLYLRSGANTQYATAAALLFSVYSDVLAKHNETLTCGDKRFDPSHVMAFAKDQMDYILGKNPLKRSYMVGFGKDPPTQAHHRGASIPVKEADQVTDCGMTFAMWKDRKGPNPNELTGAIVGGPDQDDKFKDLRSDSAMTEPTTYTNAMAIGVLAKLAAQHGGRSVS